MAAYTWIYSVLLVVFGVVAWLLLSSAMNSIGGTFYNTSVASDITTERSMQVTNNALTGMLMFPIFFIIGLLVRAINVGSQIRSTGQSPGGMQVFGAGTFVMLTMFVLAFLFALMGGFYLDTLEDKILNPNSTMSKDLPEDWQNAQGQVTAGFNIVGFIPLFTQCLGGVIFIQSVFQRTGGDAYYAAGY